MGGVEAPQTVTSAVNPFYYGHGNSYHSQSYLAPAKSTTTVFANTDSWSNYT